ncbi:MAG: Wzz/FepE/Etk N-terminal domain-containing protein [bacterium]
MEKETLTLSSILTLCKMHKRFLILFIGISVILTGIYSFIVPHQYLATATVLPPEEDGSSSNLSGFLQSISGGISLGGISKGIKIELYIEMLKSRSVAKYIVEKCELRKIETFKEKNEDILYDMVSSLIESESNRSGLMFVSAKISTPYFPSSKDKTFAAQLSADISNAAVEGLDKVNREKSNLKAKKKKNFISKVLQDNKARLDSVDAELEKFQKANKLVAIDDQTKAILENIVGVGTLLSKAEVELGIIQQQYELTAPIVKSYQRQVDDLRKQYAKTQDGGLVPTDKFSIPLSDVPNLVRHYTTLIRDQKILTQLIMYLETQKYQEAIEEESDLPTVQVLDEAFPPYKKASPSKLIMLVLALFLSTFFALAFVILRAFYRGRKSQN